MALCEPVARSKYWIQAISRMLQVGMQKASTKAASGRLCTRLVKAASATRQVVMAGLQIMPASPNNYVTGFTLS